MEIKENNGFKTFKTFLNTLPKCSRHFKSFPTNLYILYITRIKIYNVKFLDNSFEFII